MLSTQMRPPMNAHDFLKTETIGKYVTGITHPGATYQKHHLVGPSCRMSSGLPWIESSSPFRGIGWRTRIEHCTVVGPDERLISVKRVPVECRDKSQQEGKAGMPFDLTLRFVLRQTHA